LHNDADSLDPRKLWLHGDQRFGRKESDMMIIGVDYHPELLASSFFDVASTV
jgi:hypothetical protein